MIRVVVAVALAALALVAAHSSAQSPAPIAGPHELVAGRSYTQWEAAAYRWRLSLPYRAERDATACFTAKQNGPVWFLLGDFRNVHVQTRICEIPAGRYLMLFVPSVMCNDVTPERGYPTTPAGLHRCARRLWHRDGDAHPRLVIDGTAVAPSAVFTWTTAFSFRMPGRGNALARPGRTHGRAAVAGMAALIRPLAPGVHKVTQGISYQGDINRVVIYRLTVG